MSPKSRIVVSKSLCYRHDKGEEEEGGCERAHPDDDDSHTILNLMMICCEENSPYGPAADTANMFLELLCAGYERYHQQNYHQEGGSSTSDNNESTDHNQHPNHTIRITIYHAQSMDYPQTTQEWDSYDGIIIPGSLSAAYDVHIEWIHKLLVVIQMEIHEKRRKTFGVCFGHQCFAHSFGMVMHQNNEDGEQWEEESSDLHQSDGGLATKSSIGPVAGVKSFELTNEGKFLFGSTTPISCCHVNSLQREQYITKDEKHPPTERECLQLLYTRGDMVQSLPSVGISLCGNEDLPNEACAYFSSKEDVLQFQNHVQQQQQEQERNDPLMRSITPWMQSIHHGITDINLLPYAITFQAHSEYMAPTGYKFNFPNTIMAMKDHGAIGHETSLKACDDAKLHYDTLLCDSLDATVIAGWILGWWGC